MPQLPAYVFIGRFQPFHNGHLLVIKGMVKMCERLVIVIGSAQESKTADNPFTADERKEMIQRALQSVNIIPKFDVQFLEMPDMPADAKWVEEVIEKAGPVSQVWTGNPDTKKVFEDAGIEVKEIKEVPGISGTEVREKMRTRGEWERMLEPDVVDYIKSINGLERVK